MVGFKKICLRARSQVARRCTRGINGRRVLFCLVLIVLKGALTTSSINIDKLRNLAAGISNINRTISNFCESTDISRFRVLVGHSTIGILFSLTISLRLQSLRRHHQRTSLGNDSLVVCTVNVASQSRNQQSGQDGQDDQDDDQLDEGEALFVFQFF